MSSPVLSAVLALSTVLGLVSCSSVKTTMKKVTDPMKSMAKSNSVPPVVVVRKDDLRQVKSGQERIADWNRSRKSLSSGAANLPEDFDPSNFPVEGQLPASGILPPLTPGGSSSAGFITPDADLPDDVASLPKITGDDENE